jgi:hypothetical protein
MWSATTRDLRRLLTLAAGGRLGGNRPGPVAGSMIRIRNSHNITEDIWPSRSNCQIFGGPHGLGTLSFVSIALRASLCFGIDRRQSRDGNDMIRTFAIAIAAVLYVLAVGHAHHASIDHTLAPLGNAKH